MVQGFVPDYAQGRVKVGAWHPGQPQRSFWNGTQVTWDGGIPIGAFRCPECGFLEFYADNKFAAE